jgi:Putative DNA-binding domain
MNDSWLWEESDIQSLIANQVQQSLTLDVKRCESLQKTEGKKKEISKDVSAFAKSAGGTIVYGIVEDKHVPTGIDDGFDPKDITMEWIEQVINSTIEQRIDGVRIKEIALSGAKAGKSIYIVNILQSKRAPHMASDNRYYKRFNFESLPMADYEVKDVSRRLEVPDLCVEFRPDTPGRFEPDPNVPDRFKPINVRWSHGTKARRPQDMPFSAIASEFPVFRAKLMQITSSSADSVAFGLS